MNYLLKSSNFAERKRSERRRVLIVTFFLLVGIIILSSQTVRNMFFSISTPIWKLENMVLNSSFFDYFKSRETLIGEKLALEQKLFMSGNLLSMNDILKSENDDLKSLLGRDNENNKKVLASVLVRPPQTPYDSIIIDIGEDYNVLIGDKVIAESNVYLGEVSEVLAHNSKVRLYSSTGEKIPVLLGENKISVEAVGTGGSNFKILLPREVEVSENDTIVIPSATPNLFGIVEEISFQEKDSYQTVLFRSPINISQLSFVEVIINKKHE